MTSLNATEPPFHSSTALIFSCFVILAKGGTGVSLPFCIKEETESPHAILFFVIKMIGIAGRKCCMNERAEVEEFCALLRAKVPLIFVESHEEPRILKLLSQACNLENQLMMRWSVVDGLGRVFGTGSGIVREEQGGMTLDGQGNGIYQTNDLFDCLRYIDKTTQNGVYVLCDAHPGFKDSIAVRLMREIGMDHAKCARTLVFISPSLEDVPTELLRLADHFKPRLPTRDDIKAIVAKEAKLYQSQSVREPN